MREPKIYKLSTGEEVKIARFNFRLYVLENGVITRRRCSVCKKFLDISEFMLFNLHDRKRLYHKCLACKRESDRESATKKRRTIGQKPMRYVELLHVRQDDVVGIVCTKCGIFYPLCDYRIRKSVVHGREYTWQTSICKHCNSRALGELNKKKRRVVKNSSSHPWNNKNSIALNKSLRGDTVN
jgi:hypothetical protein